MNIEEKVAKWNRYYSAMCAEGLSNDPDNYEEEVGYALKAVTGSWENALAVFLHDDNDGGWICGDVEAFIRKELEKCGKLDENSA